MPELERNAMIVTLDGPAGAGKSSIARLLAKRLGFAFMDTGAMYRAVTWACLQKSTPLNDVRAVVATAEALRFDFADDRVLINDQDVTPLLRTHEVTQAIRPIADNIHVRRYLVDQQRMWAGSRNVVTEGRDQGTVAFPTAECKIFLTASPEERARRRVAQLAHIGVSADYEEILRGQTRRDDEDIQRVEGGLKAAPDAVYVHTDGLSEEEVLDRLVQIVRAKHGAAVVSS